MVNCDVANHQCEKGQVLKCGIIRSGCRSYIGVKGGFDVPEYLGSQATQLLANEPNTAGLECTLQGPTLKFHCDSQIVITGVICHQN